MAIKVIGTGFGRTGTASLKVALEELGLGPCYHMSEVLKDLSRIDQWLAAADGKPDWETIYASYHACVDFPSCTFYRELAAEYPDAKVVLTIRDPGSWFDSVHATIMSPRFTEFIGPSPFGELNKRVAWDLFDGRIHDRDHMIACFERHTAQVREAIPADRLLVYEVREGWGPLCAFLGVDAPETPFPRTNSKQEIAEFLEGIIAAGDSAGAKMGASADGLFEGGKGDRS